jgi:hypothetical protein
MVQLILKANGSDIKLWWLFHHYSSIAVSATMLLWYVCTVTCVLTCLLACDVGHHFRYSSNAIQDFVFYFRAFTLYQGAYLIAGLVFGACG